MSPRLPDVAHLAEHRVLLVRWHGGGGRERGRLKQRVEVRVDRAGAAVDEGPDGLEDARVVHGERAVDFGAGVVVGGVLGGSGEQAAVGGGGGGGGCEAGCGQEDAWGWSGRGAGTVETCCGTAHVRQNACGYQRAWVSFMLDVGRSSVLSTKERRRGCREDLQCSGCSRFILVQLDEPLLVRPMAAWPWGKGCR